MSNCSTWQGMEPHCQAQAARAITITIANGNPRDPASSFRPPSLSRSLCLPIWEHFCLDFHFYHSFPQQATHHHRAWTDPALIPVLGTCLDNQISPKAVFRRHSIQWRFTRLWSWQKEGLKDEFHCVIQWHTHTKLLATSTSSFHTSIPQACFSRLNLPSPAPPHSAASLHLHAEPKHLRPLSLTQSSVLFRNIFRLVSRDRPSQGCMAGLSAVRSLSL